MSKQSVAKQKRRQKRLEIRKMEERADQNLAFLSKSFKIIDEKLKETDKEFADAYEVFENLKDKYLFVEEDEDEEDSFLNEEKERFDQAFNIVMAKKFGILENVMERSFPN